MKKVLKFEATWCQPCKMLSKVFDDAGSEITIDVERIDIDQQPDLAKQYGIRGVPTLVVLDDGVETARKSGMMKKADLLEFLA